MPELPKYHETFLPILKVLSSNDRLYHGDLALLVKSQYYSDLPPDLLNKTTSTGKSVLLDRIGWGKSYLKMGKYLDYPERGMVQITEKGKIASKAGKPSLSDLKRDPDFILYRQTQSHKTIDEIKETNLQNESPQDLIDSGFTAIEKQIKAELLERLQSIDPYYFEKVI